MKILILDIYPDRPHRISKDTIGGFGTANRFGDGLISRAITWVFARGVDWPPLYCVYVAGVLRQQGHEVVYSRTWPTDGGCDLCLATSSIVCHETEVAAIRKVAETATPVGVIGSFAAVVSKPYLEAGAFVIGGEPEMYFMRHPLSQESLHDLKGLVPAATVPLDDLPLPAWDLIFSKNPPKFSLLGNKGGVLPILSTRGCPYSCQDYCVYPLQQGRKVRNRSPEKVVEEMIHWNETLGVSYFIFRDPVFAINRKHTLALCDAIEASGRSFNFTIEPHLKNLDPVLCRRLRKVGLDMLKVGIESVEPHVLESAKRAYIGIDEQSERIAFIEKLGVKVTCHYIFGMPGDSLEICKNALRYACRLNSLFIQISVFTPYPGTPSFSKFNDKILVDRYEDFTQYDLVFQHNSLSPKDIRELLTFAYGKYYGRIRWVLKFLRSRFS